MKIMLLKKDTQRCIVTNPKTMKYWKTLIDKGGLRLCAYKFKNIKVFKDGKKETRTRYK